jgi:hypothetical protein
VIKALLSGAAAAALLGVATAASAAIVRAEAPAWVVTPGADSCRTELELTGASGSGTSLALVSDGDAVRLVFAKDDAPERAFLPIRIDHRPYPNLVLRQADGRTAAMQLSPETLTALKKGGALQISWLADEPLEASLAGSVQALSDLRTCGAQVAQRYREQQAAARDAEDRAASEARAQAIADGQLAAARAQKDAAEAEAQRSAAEAAHLRAETERQRREEERDSAEQQAQAEAYPYARVRTYPDPREYGPPAGYPVYGAPPPYQGW